MIPELACKTYREPRSLPLFLGLVEEVAAARVHLEGVGLGLEVLIQPVLDQGVLGAGTFVHDRAVQVDTILNGKHPEKPLALAIVHHLHGHEVVDEFTCRKLK